MTPELEKELNVVLWCLDRNRNLNHSEHLCLDKFRFTINKALGVSSNTTNKVRSTKGYFYTSEIDKDVTRKQYRAALYEVYKTLGFDCDGDTTADSWVDLCNVVMRAAKEHRKQNDQDSEQLGAFQKETKGEVIMGVGTGLGHLFIRGSWEAITIVRKWMACWEKNHPNEVRP